jgi:hypothetical protein
VLDVRSPNPSNIVYAKIKPRGSDHIKQALANMLNGSKHGPLKVAMVFDNDVDIWVAQCMAFRYIPDRDTCNATSTDPQIGDVDRPGRRQIDDGGSARRGLTSFLEQAPRAWNEILQNYRAARYAMSAAPCSAAPSPIGIRAQAARAPIKDGGRIPGLGDPGARR